MPGVYFREPGREGMPGGVMARAALPPGNLRLWTLMLLFAALALPRATADVPFFEGQWAASLQAP